jgi:hypothetical protein
MKYTVQRPVIIWVETQIESAVDQDDALEQADVKFQNGDYLEMDGTWAIDYDRFWIQDESGKEAHDLGKE